MNRKVKMNLDKITISKIDKYHSIFRKKGLVKSKSDTLKLLIDIGHLATQGGLILKNSNKKIYL